MSDIEARMWTHVQETATCWYWMGHVNWSGYGIISERDGAGSRTKFLVHRLAWSSVNGPIPPRACVLHSCDVRRCVNPSHLRLGTRAENSADMVSRNRSGKGEAHTQAVLTEVQVRAIRACQLAGMTQTDTAKAFGISRSAVGLIWNRLRWGHVE